MRHTLLFAAVLPLLLCSCQSLQRGTDASPAGPGSAPTAKVQPAAAPPSGQDSGLPRGMRTRGLPYGVQPAQYSLPAHDTLPPSAWTGQPGTAGPHIMGGSCPHCGPAGLPAFHFTDGGPSEELSWMPDGLKCPWPQDEFVCDGGDLNHDVLVKQDWTVVGLDQQDTIAHFDTVDGRTEVVESNCVCIYSPRFAAVRQVTSPILHEGHERMAGVVKPAKLNIHEENRGPKTATQPEQLLAQVGLDQSQAFRERIRGLLVEQRTQLILATDAFLPHEDLLFIQRGQF
jgi:hypothetical protein